MNDNEVIDTIPEIVNQLFGEYQPITYTYTTEHDEAITLADGTTSTVTLQETHTDALFNWSWFAGPVIFAIMLFCILKMVGGLISCKI